jgi:hypothetical protein
METFAVMKSFPYTVLSLIVCLASVVAHAQDKPSEPISPKDGVITLFNGRDLSGLYAWLGDTKYDDPRRVFTVHDGLLHISGDGFGYVATKDTYRDYHLVAEFKWGPRTWAPRKEKAKDSGILLHCVGPDGNGGNWMAAIEYQLIEGGVGDFIVVGGKYADGSSVPMSLTCETIKDRDGETVWKAGGERKTLNRGRVNWYGRDPDWKDVLGFRGAADVEKPDGQWNLCEAVCRGGHIRNYVNGVLVNEGFDAFPAAGKIAFQTECAELFFRKIELHPLKSR